jgi:hypothetical protein
MRNILSNVNIPLTNIHRTGKTKCSPAWATYIYKMYKFMVQDSKEGDKKYITQMMHVSHGGTMGLSIHEMTDKIKYL